MFEIAQLSEKISKADYKAQLPELRYQLLQAQNRLRQARVPMLIIIEGLDNASRGEMVNLLNEWLDARGLNVIAFGEKTDEELQRPRFWRYWRELPPAGTIGIMAGSWYTGNLIGRVMGEVDRHAFDHHLRRISNLERMLALDGTLILKIWLHTSEKAQAKRFKALSKEHLRWGVSRLDKKLHKRYDKALLAAERAIRLTDTALAPWHIINNDAPRARNLRIARLILSAIESRTEMQDNTPSLPVVEIPPTRQRSVLETVDLSQSLERDEYKRRLSALQARLTDLSWEAYHRKISTVCVFEGWDAAGKGGAIRRLLHAIDARISRVIQIAAPTDEEKAHHYLWRFWRHLPRAGRTIIYDRSWYGRVLVERVEGFARPDEWRRAYFEINDFEEQLVEDGIVLAKFWLHIDPDEQLRRFKAREETPYKRYKITDEDWRNREKWPEYELAVNEMVERTSTEFAPWHLIPANDKPFARVKVVETVVKALEKALS
ncbi:MAG: polyphosphate:AMP phosphotransferase [Gammaproteobacteria bacterium]|nr:MAG: polyphosphate:AMP phosphotransferase [Gammaproteobacteria bacterium]